MTPGQLAGSFVVSYPQGGSGFIKTGSSFTAVNVSNASFTGLQGINDAGQAVGDFGQLTAGGRGSEHGFILSDSMFTQVDLRPKRQTLAWTL